MLSKHQVQTMYFLEKFKGNIFLQTFIDEKQKKNSGAAQGLISTNNLPLEDIEEKLNALQKMNEAGAGIYFGVNEVSGEKRSNDTVCKIRAAFLDLDGAPLGPVLKFKMPSIVVRTSKEKFHCYWMLNDKPLNNDKVKFREVQKKLSAVFNGDRSISDPARVMRIPGFYNMKSEPFLITHCFPTAGMGVADVIAAMEKNYAV